MKVFEFRYNKCIYGGLMETISIHATENGANKALQTHKKQKEKEKKWEKITKIFKPLTPFTPSPDSARWDVIETEVLE